MHIHDCTHTYKHFSSYTVHRVFVLDERAWEWINWYLLTTTLLTLTGLIITTFRSWDLSWFCSGSISGRWPHPPITPSLRRGPHTITSFPLYIHYHIISFGSHHTTSWLMHTCTCAFFLCYPVLFHSYTRYTATECDIYIAVFVQWSL